MAKPTVEALFYLMPGPLDLPAGWTSAAGMPSGELSPNQGDGVGVCGGPNGDLRAKNNGVVAAMAAPTIFTEDGGAFSFHVYAFGADVAAEQMMKATFAQAQCGYREYKLPEGSGSGQYDGFSESFGEGRATWTIRDALTVGNPNLTDAPGAFFMKTESEYFTNVSGTNYGSKDTTIVLYEQHGRFVFTVSLYGSCCAYGFSNTATTNTYEPTLDVLLAGMQKIRPIVIKRLVDNLLLAE